MRDSTKAFWLDVVVIALLIIGLVAVASFFSGCKTIRHLTKSTSDTTSVSKLNEGASKSDSSGSKSDKTYSKETVYYPQPIYIQGKDGETKLVVVPQTVKETGTEKNEDFSVKKDESWREAFDSLSSKILSLSQDKKTTVGPSFIEWILIIVAGLIFLKSFSPPAINFLHKLINKT